MKNIENTNTNTNTGNTGNTGITGNTGNNTLFSLLTRGRVSVRNNINVLLAW